MPFITYQLKTEKNKTFNVIQPITTDQLTILQELDFSIFNNDNGYSNKINVLGFQVNIHDFINNISYSDIDLTSDFPESNFDIINHLKEIVEKRLRTLALDEVLN